jgi:hypothetical protein
MTRNTVHGDNFGIQAGTVHGGITIHHDEVVLATGTADPEDDGDVVNTVHGDNYGVQAGHVHGEITTD